MKPFPDTVKIYMSYLFWFAQHVGVKLQLGVLSPSKPTSYDENLFCSTYTSTLAGQFVRGIQGG